MTFIGEILSYFFYRFRAVKPKQYVRHCIHGKLIGYARCDNCERRYRLEHDTPNKWDQQ